MIAFSRCLFGLLLGAAALPVQADEGPFRFVPADSTAVFKLSGPAAFAEAVFPELLKTFKPAFLGRLTVVPYYPLSDDVMKKIIKLKLGKIARRVRQNYRADFRYTDDLVDTIAERCTEVDTGARNVDHILNGTLLPEMSSEFLARMAEGLPIASVEVSADGEGAFRYEIS